MAMNCVVSKKGAELNTTKYTLEEVKNRRGVYVGNEFLSNTYIVSFGNKMTIYVNAEGQISGAGLYASRDFTEVIADVNMEIVIRQ